MALSGYVGGAVSDEMQQIVAQRLLEEQIRQRQEQQAIENTQRDREFAFRESEARANREERAAERQRLLEEDARVKRTLGNMAGVLEMTGSGLDPEAARREIAMTGLRAGVETPRAIEGLLPIKGGGKLYEVTVPGPNGRPVKRLFTQEQMQAGVQEYREPKTPSAQKNDRQWLMRNGQPIYTADIQPGDRPFDKATDGKPPAPTGNAYSDERATRSIEAVDSLMGKVGRSTTGAGSLLSMIPETAARNFAAELDTLKANIAFNELAEMRAASKTGGALGAVSERELGLLESSLGALDPGQSPAQFRAQLQRIKDSIQRYQQAKSSGRMVPSHGGPPGGGSVDRSPRSRFSILSVK